MDTKNIGPFLAFNIKWFEKHQGILIWLLNNRFTKRWFRWILRIRRCDIGYDKEIIQLLPNSYTVFDKYLSDDKVQLTTDFRTHPKFGKRIYYAFQPLWWAMHIWDLLADRVTPSLSFGFQTLTGYTSASDPGIVGVDGSVYRTGVDETFATIRAGAGTNKNSLDTDQVVVDLFGSSTVNKFATFMRYFTFFDTTALPSSATISAATISLYGTSKTNTIGSPDLHVASSTVSTNTTYAITDFQNVGTTTFGNVTYANYSVVGYNDISLNASGIANITKQGVSKFSWQLSWDINNSFTGSWISNSGSFLNANTADNTGLSTDPKLVVTYTTASFKGRGIRPRAFGPGLAR
jgi:hypothetical protein